MKRRVIYIIGAMMFALFATSCSENTDVVERYVDIEISTAIEANYLDEEYSRAESGFEVDDVTYDMRYTIELWSDSEVIYRAEKVVSTISGSLTHSFRAVEGDYRLVIFADYVKVNDDGDVSESHYTTTKGLDKITITETEGVYTYEANDPSRDCYGYSEDLEITSSFSLSGITLKRPMAKMTLVDVEPENVAASSAVAISYGSATSLPYGYNLVAEEVLTGEEVTVTYSETTADDQEILAYDYIFISAATNYLMTFKVGEKEVSATVNFEQNKTTNITATFFTGE